MTRLAAALLLATSLASAQSGDTGPVVSRYGTPDANPPRQVWTAWLAGARPSDMGRVATVVATLSDESGSVTEHSCAEHRKLIRETLAAVPVSIALWVYAGRCADLLDDLGWSRQADQAAQALVQQTLSELRAPGQARPARIVGQTDANMLVQLSARGVLHAHYQVPTRGRHLELVVAMQSLDGQHEEHWRFDFLDALVTLARDEPQLRWPLRRAELARELIRNMAGNPGTEATIAAALLKAEDAQTPQARRSALLAAGALGESAALWVGTRCVRVAVLDCAEAGVDLLIPVAEQPRAMAYVALAYAYAEGRGVARDPEAARRLLATADRRLGGVRGTLAFQALAASPQVHAPLHPLADATLRRAATRDALAAYAVARASGDWSLGVPPQAQVWLQRAAAGGVADARADLAMSALEAGRAAEGLAQLRAAARAGSTAAALRLASVLQRDPQVARDEAEARRWLERAARDDDVDALLELAGRSEPPARAAPDRRLETQLLQLLAHGPRDALRALTRGLSDPARALQDAEAQLQAAYGAVRDEARLGSARKLLWAALPLDPKSAAYRKRAEQLLRADALSGDPAARGRYGRYWQWGLLPDASARQAQAWFQEALEAGDPETRMAQADAWYYGPAEVQDVPRALAAWSALWEQQGNVRALNSLAWARCTAAEDSIYDPAQARVLAQALDQALPEHFGAQDTVAACLAAAGDAAGAAALQARLNARLLGHSAIAERADRRLQSYRAGKPFRQTHEDMLAELRSAAD